MAAIGQRCTLVAALLLVWPMTVDAAEAPPSVDCARAVTVIDKMICGDPKLAEADRKLADTYARVRRELSPESFATVRAVQRAWLRGSRAACAPGHVIDGEKLSDKGANECLDEQYGRQLYLIDIPMKTIGGLRLEGRLRMHQWLHPKVNETDQAPWLVGVPAAKAEAFNQAIFNELKPDRNQFADAGFDDMPDAVFTYNRSYALHHADERLISLDIEIFHEANFGHGWQEETAFNWDLARDRPLDFDGLFQDETWKAAIVEYAINDAKDQMKQDPGDLISEASVDDPAAWVFDDDGATIRFGHRERSGAGASIEVTIPYDVLAPLLRSDTPLPISAASSADTPR
jgi:uncharacterized protein YecT (DUF1311 family)